jgi:general secretion pathway protein H
MRTAPRSDRRNTRRGFTLVEVLVVVVIISIASAIVAPRILASGSMGAQAATRMLIADLLYAQNEAIAQQRDVRVSFVASPTGNRFTLTYVDGGPLNVKWKGGAAGDNYTTDFDADTRFSGVTIESAAFGPAGSEVAYIDFDAIGVPSAAGSVVLTYDEQRYRVSVSEFTGRVTAERLPVTP